MTFPGFTPEQAANERSAAILQQQSILNKLRLRFRCVRTCNDGRHVLCAITSMHAVTSVCMPMLVRFASYTPLALCGMAPARPTHIHTAEHAFFMQFVVRIRHCSLLTNQHVVLCPRTHLNWGVNRSSPASFRASDPGRAQLGPAGASPAR